MLHSYFALATHELKGQAVYFSRLFTIQPIMYCMNSLLCQIKLLSRHIGKSVEEIAQDIKRPKYFSPSEAVDYGIIDKVKFLE